MSISPQWVGIHYFEMKWKWNPQSIYKNEKFKKLWDVYLLLSVCFYDCGWYTRALFNNSVEKKVQKKRNTDWLEEK